MRFQALILPALLCGVSWAAPLPQGTLAPKPFGVLLLGESGDRDLSQAVDGLRRALSPKFPLEFAAGPADKKAIEKAVQSLESRHVRMIVAVPLFLSSFSEAMDQNRFLLGIRETPSKEFLEAPHSHNRSYGMTTRIRTKLPVVLTKALDGHPLLVEILAERARPLSRDPAREALVLVGQGPASAAAAKDWLASAQAIAEKVRQKGGFKAASAAALPQGPGQQDREKAENDLRALVRKLRLEGRVIAIPLELTRAGIQSRIPKVLDGLFVRFDGKTILPDPLIARWISESAAEGSKLPDMRLFKKEGSPERGLPAMPPITTRGNKK